VLLPEPEPPVMAMRMVMGRLRASSVGFYAGRGRLTMCVMRRLR